MNAQDFLSGVYLDNAKFTKQEVIEIMEQYHAYQIEYSKQLVDKLANGRTTAPLPNAVLCGVSHLLAFLVWYRKHEEYHAWSVDVAVEQYIKANCG